MLFLKFQVAPYDAFGLSIYPNEGRDNEDLIIYITEPGEEYFMHLYLWRTIPFSFKLSAQLQATDVMIKKVETIKDVSCTDDKDYNYIGIRCF